MSLLRRIFIPPLKATTRVVAQVRKELIQVRRRPGAFISLVLGPFLIMAVFGVGFTGERRPLETVVVVPESLDLPAEPQYYQDVAGPAVNVREVTTDAAAARAQLDQQVIDMVITTPPDAVARFNAGEQAEIVVEINTTDPVNAGYAAFLAGYLSQEVNREILTRAISEGESYAVRRVGQEVTDIPPEVIAAPTTATISNIAPSQPSIVAFAAPAVLALILQHMAVTLTALSFVRERLSGALELFRVSPVNPLELVLGKYLGLGLVSAVIAVITTLLLVTVLGVPLLGDPWLVAGIVVLLVLASLGVGLLISVVADSERQAVQLSLLMLLASVFFSGFVLAVDEFRLPVQVAAYALPVTSGIALLQDVMLRGTTNSWWQVAVLGGLAIGLLILTWALLRRTMHAA